MPGLPPYDALIVGAGPAGAALARQLARGGWRVLLIDREPPGRDRACGGFLGPERLALWRELDLERHLDALPAAPLRRLLITSRVGARIDAPLPEGGGVGVSRATFDRWLCDRAQACGVELRMPARLTQLARTSGGWRAELRHAGGAWPLRSRVVVRACGRRLTVPRSGEPWFGCKTIYAGGAPGDAVALHLVAGGLVGFDRLPDGRLTMCLYVGLSRLRAARGDLDGMLARLAEENAALAHQLAPLRRVAPWISCLAQPDDRLRFVEHGCVQVGDGVTMLNPMLGGGMTVAMGSAALLARTLLSRSSTALQPERFAPDYARAWMRQYAWRVRFGRWLGWCERRARLADRVMA
jgi:flavin-dependent dehydrogenase